MSFNRSKQSPSGHYSPSYSKVYGKEYGQKDKIQGDQKTHYIEKRYYQYDNRKYDKDYNEMKGEKTSSYDSHYPPHNDQAYYNKRGQRRLGNNYSSPDARYRDRSSYHSTSGPSPSHQNYTSYKSNEEQNRNKIHTDCKSTQTDEAYSPVNSHTQTCSYITGVGSTMSDTMLDDVLERHLEYKNAIRKIQFQQPILPISSPIPVEYDPKLIQQYYRWDPIVNNVLFDEDAIDGPMDTIGYKFWSENSAPSKYHWKKTLFKS